METCSITSWFPRVHLYGNVFVTRSIAMGLHVTICTTCLAINISRFSLHRTDLFMDLVWFSKQLHFPKQCSLSWRDVLLDLRLSQRWLRRVLSYGIYNALQSCESQPTFRTNISPPSSGSKSKPSNELVWNRQQTAPCLLPGPCWFLACLILRLWIWKR
jgi:hypothetical protein